MKKLLTCLLMTLICFSTCALGNTMAFAASEPDIHITVDGNPVVSDSAPFIENGRTFVPVRPVLEAYPVDSVDWQAPNVMVVLGGTRLTIPVGEKQIYKNGISIPTDTAAVIRNGRAYLPIRGIIELLGGVVNWDADSRTVSITHGKTSVSLPVEKEIIRIGVIEPMTGADAAGGAAEYKGISIANRLYPTVLGKKVELVLMDNQSDKVASANAASSLMEDEKVVSVIGSYGSRYSMALGPLVQESQVPAVGASCTNPLVTWGNDYYFRVCFIDPFQGAVMANYAYHELGYRKVAIIQDCGNDYSIGLSKYFEDVFIKLTGNPNAITAMASYYTGDTDFSYPLEVAAGVDCDAIFVPGEAQDSALLIRQAREKGIKTQFLGGTTWDMPEFIQTGGEAVNGVVYPYFYDDQAFTSAISQAFLAEYKKESSEQNAGVSALGFDAYRLVLNAIERAGSSNPTDIQKALSQTKNFQGITGTITIDENGDPIKSAVIKSVLNGQSVYVKTVNP